MEQLNKIQLIKNGKLIITQETIDFVVNEYLNNRKSFTQIAKEQGCSEYQIRKLYHQTNNPVRSDREQALKYNVNENFFEQIDSEEKAYWLGFMYADGYIMDKRKYNNYKIGISLGIQDKQHLEKFKSAIGFTGNIKEYSVSSGYKVGAKYCRILITSNKLAEDLIDKGCFIKKTDKLVFPTERQVPVELRLAFIRGLIDGDGSIVFTKIDDPVYRTYSIGFTGTLNICNMISQILLGKTNILAKRHKERNNDNYTLSIGGNIQVATLLTKIYGNASVYLDRKYERYLQVLEFEKEAYLKNPKRHNCVIRKVRCIETQEVFNNCVEAAKAVGLKSSTGIHYCLNGQRKKSGNYHWEWAE